MADASAPARIAGDALPAEIVDWLEGVVGSALTQVVPVVGGASRASAILTFADGGRRFLRREGGQGPLAGTPFTLAREHAVLRRLEHSAVPIARCIAWSPELEALLMAFVPGFTLYDRGVPEAEGAALRRGLMQAVVALQAIDPGEVPTLALASAATIGATLEADLALWRRLYREGVASPDPLIEAAFAFALDAVPDADAAPVLVHGDIGPGNFLIDDGRLAALIDWELARIGHPLEDLACIIARGLGVPFGEPAEHIANYEALSGRPVDRRALDHALVLVLLRWNVAISIGLERPVLQQNVPVLMTFRLLNGIAMLEAMRRGAGLPALPAEAAAGDDAPAPPRPASAAAFAWVRAAATSLADARTLRADERAHARGVAGLLAYLEARDRYGGDRYDAEDVAATAALLGRAFANRVEADAALCHHAREARGPARAALLELLDRRQGREHRLMRATLGPLADNRIDLEATP